MKQAFSQRLLRIDRSRWRRRHVDRLTLLAACRAAIQVIRRRRGINYESYLGPVIQECETFPSS